MTAILSILMVAAPLPAENTTPAFEVASVKPTALEASGPMKMQRKRGKAGG
jgi:hypothetical protein